MSYGVHAYAVDLGRIRSLVGSGDEALLGQLLSEHAADLPQLDELLEVEIDEGEPSVTDALRLILRGEMGDAEPDNAQYGYALELICRSIGHSMFPAQLVQLSAEWLGKQSELNVLGAVSGPLTGLIPLPFEFPGVGCIGPDEIDSRLQRAHEAASRVADPVAIDCYGEYIGWLEAARERNAALVSFLY